MNHTCNNLYKKIQEIWFAIRELVLKTIDNFGCFHMFFGVDVPKISSFIGFDRFLHKSERSIDTVVKDCPFYRLETLQHCPPIRCIVLF